MKLGGSHNGSRQRTSSFDILRPTRLSLIVVVVWIGSGC
jgi:hypothetical protein